MSDALLIRGGRVLTARSRVAERTDVLVDGGAIAAIAPGLEPGEGTRIVDGNGSLLIPGLVDCHLHSADALLRGSIQSLPLELWLLRAYPILGGEPVLERLVYLRTLLVAIECLRSGTTCVLDDVVELSGLSLSSLGAVFQAYQDCGIRASCTGSVVDRSALEALPGYEEIVPAALRRELAAAPLPSLEGYLEFSAEAVRRFHQPQGRLRYVVAPSGPQWCSDELLGAATEFALRHRLNCHIHVAETRIQAQAARSQYRRSAIAHLRGIGALTPHTTIAHAIWLEDGDVELIAEAGSAIAHNPISNQRLGSGIAAVWEFLEAGIPVGLGADNPSASDALGMFAVMRAAALLATLAREDHAEWLSSEQVLRAATEGGARCARLEDEIGSIEIGKRADLVLLDLAHSAFTPENDPVTQLVFGDPVGAVQTVVVDGRVVVEQGRVLTIDEDAVREELGRYLPRYRRDHADAESRSMRYARYVERMLERSRG